MGDRIHTREDNYKVANSLAVMSIRAMQAGKTHKAERLQRAGREILRYAVQRGRE